MSDLVVKKLSHSKVSRYMMCPRSYKYHYVDKLTTIVKSAALDFGSAMDKALNELLLPLEVSKTPEAIFLEEFSKDGRKTDVNAVYANTDFDEDLLMDEDLEEGVLLLKDFGIENAETSMVMREFKNIRSIKNSKGYDGLNEKQRKYYNLINWLCLYRKGLIILRDYRLHILPMFKKVLKVQIEINHQLDEETVINGFIDFIAQTQDGRIILFDNKTSGSAYAEDAVIKSPQLSLYVEACKTLLPDINIDAAGYVVMRKNIAKNSVKKCKSCGHIGKGRHSTCDNIISGRRCGGDWGETISPEAQFQILIDEIPQNFKNMVISNFSDVNEGIKKEVFPRNFDKCNNWYGSPCPHREYCFHGNMKGLQKDAIKKD